MKKAVNEGKSWSVTQAWCNPQGNGITPSKNGEKKTHTHTHMHTRQLRHEHSQRNDLNRDTQRYIQKHKHKC